MPICGVDQQLDSSSKLQQPPYTSFNTVSTIGCVLYIVHCTLSLYIVQVYVVHYTIVTLYFYTSNLNCKLYCVVYIVCMHTMYTTQYTIHCTRLTEYSAVLRLYEPSNRSNNKAIHNLEHFRNGLVVVAKSVKRFDDFASARIPSIIPDV